MTVLSVHRSLRYIDTANDNQSVRDVQLTYHARHKNYLQYRHQIVSYTPREFFCPLRSAKKYPQGLTILAVAIHFARLLNNSVSQR